MQKNTVAESYTEICAEYERIMRAIEIMMASWHWIGLIPLIPLTQIPADVMTTAKTWYLPGYL